MAHSTHRIEARRGVRLISAPSLFAVVLLTAITMSEAQSQVDAIVGEQGVQAWILYRCDVSDDEGERISLQALGTDVEAALIRVAEQGPPPDLMESFERQLRESWASRAPLLEAGAETGLGPELIELLRTETEQEFMSVHRRDFEIGYRQKAIRGLAGLGTDAARPVLERLIRTRTDVLSDTAEATLQEIDRRLNSAD